MISTAKILVKGRNFPLLLERMKNNDVKLIKIKIIGDTERIITVKYEDLEKVFAILGNMWYNTLLEVNGFIGFFNKIKKNLIVIFCVLAFILASYLFDKAIVKVDVNGVTGEKLSKVYSVLEECGIRNGKISFNYDIKSLKKTLFKNLPSVDFVTVKKSGNRLIINLFCNFDTSEKINLKKSITAEKSGKILKIVTYSGTAVKSVGDYCHTCETLVEGYYLNKSGERVDTGCVAYYLIECCYEAEYPAEDITIESVYLKALFDGQIEEEKVVSYVVTPKVIALKGGKEKTICYRIKVTYLFEGS